MKHFFSISLTFFLVSAPFLLFSQRPQPSLPPGTGMLTGSIVDENSQPIQYAAIYLFKLPDSLTVEMAVTDEEGRFSISPIPYGEYYIELSFIGYAKHRSNTFTLNEKNPVFRLSRFKLTDKTTQLGTVEVRAQRDMLQSNLDKKVFNVESSITADGATAVEILQDIPSVDVDIEGNVTLRGSKNVTILVDGRPSNLTLEQIPASQIESIEVITNPSARLEPDGMAGILNVVLKKRKESGFNGLFGLGGSLSFFEKKPYFENYNGNINLNYSYNKINIFLNYNHRRWGRRSSGDMERTSWFNRDTSYLDQYNTSRSFGYSHNVRAGLDWFINKQNTLSFSFGFNYNKHDSKNELFSDNSYIRNGEKIPYMVYNQNGGSGNNGHNFSGNINYLKTFETKGRELSADLYFSQMNRDAGSHYVQLYQIPDTAENYHQQTKTIGINRNGSAQLDFVTPVGNGGRIETGYKFSLRHDGQDYSLLSGRQENDLQIDSNQTNNFFYSEYINAAYFIYSNSFWEKLKVQAGLRAELANTISDLKSADTAINNNYFNIFPTVHVRYDINSKHTLQLSYSRRVSRPRIHQLNPFVDISDKLNLRTGNPTLKPEFVNSFELGYMMIINKSSLNVTAFYRQRNNVISRYTQILEGFDDSTSYTYTLTSYENLNKSQNFGFEIVYGQRLWKFWRINCNADFYRVIINSDHLIDENLTRDWAWGFRINQTFTLPKNWDLQMNFRFRSASLTTGSMGWGTGGVGQGRRSPTYSLNVGAKKGFFNNNFVVSLNIRNLLYRRNTDVHTYSYEETNGYDAYSTRRNSAFQATVSLTYKVNNYKRRSDERPNGDYEMEE